MKFTHILILFAALGCVAVFLSMLLPGLFIWACAIAFIVFMLGVALSIEIIYKERQEKSLEQGKSEEIPEPEYAEVGEGPYTTPAIDSSDYKLELRRIRVNSYKKYFNIDSTRAAAIYDRGYDNLSKISKATVTDLVKIDGINPTLAKKIIGQLKGGNG
jgi:hypothetical protein